MYVLEETTQKGENAGLVVSVEIIQERQNESRTLQLTTDLKGSNGKESKKKKRTGDNPNEDFE